jgi:hypothetical protein
MHSTDLARRLRSLLGVSSCERACVRVLEQLQRLAVAPEAGYQLAEFDDRRDRDRGVGGAGGV